MKRRVFIKKTAITAGALSSSTLFTPFLKTGMNFKKNNEIRMYPNPLKEGYLHFSEYVSVEIFTLHGKLVARYKNTNSILPSLDAGAYLLKMSDGNQHVIEKLIMY